MPTVDFRRGTSTHDLLFNVFASEIGLSAVSSADVQHLALVESFESLQETIFDKMGESFCLADSERPGAVAIPITWAQDAGLFLKLYVGFNRETDPVRILLSKVYPLIGQAFCTHTLLREHVAGRLAAHVQEYGPAVGHRIVRALPMFDMYCLIPALRCGA